MDRNQLTARIEARMATTPEGRAGLAVVEELRTIAALEAATEAIRALPAPSALERRRARMASARPGLRYA